jgi:hypothetical protein
MKQDGNPLDEAFEMITVGVPLMHDVTLHLNTKGRPENQRPGTAFSGQIRGPGHTPLDYCSNLRFSLYLPP